MTKKTNAATKTAAIATKMAPVLKALSHEPMDMSAAAFSPEHVDWDMFVDVVKIKGMPWYLASDVRAVLNQHYNMPQLLCIAGVDGFLLLDTEGMGEQRYYISQEAFAGLLLHRLLAYVA